MSESGRFVASLIEAGAAGYAAAAADLLLERHPETAAQFGDGAFRSWKDHLTQRSRELAAAILIGEPRLLVAEIAWSRAGFAAREVPLGHLRNSLLCLREVLANELPEAARELAGGFLEQGLEALSAPRDEAGEPPGPAGAEDRLALAYLEALLSGDRPRAVATVLGAVDDGLPAREAYVRVLSATQREVGRMWHSWELGVAQEHSVTAATQGLMALLVERAERKAPNGKTVAVAVAPGNAHELGARAVADFFELEGWRSVFLGGSLPAADVALGLQAFEADLLALSVTLLPQLGAAMEVVRAARAARPELRVLVGGRVLDSAPELWRRLGADGSAAGLEEAVAAGARLVGIGP